MTIPDPVWNELAGLAVRSRDHARADFSGFRVGAALWCGDGRFFGGCNVENATLGLTVCAERVALWKALSEGAGSFVALVVVADTEELTPPCGACRQIIWEFAGDIPVRMMNLAGAWRETTAAALLPGAFDRRFLSGAAGE